MARARRLKSGAPAHEFSAEERSRGGRVRAARIAEERAEQQRLAADRARELVHRALDKVEDALDGGDARLALTAARDILDRTLGKQLVGTSTEPITVKLDMGLGAEPWARWASDEELEAVEEIVVRAEGRRDRDEKPPAGKSKPRRAAGKKRAPRKRPATSRRSKQATPAPAPAAEQAPPVETTEPPPVEPEPPARRRRAPAISSDVMGKQF